MVITLLVSTSNCKMESLLFKNFITLNESVSKFSPIFLARSSFCPKFCYNKIYGALSSRSQHPYKIHNAHAFTDFIFTGPYIFSITGISCNLIKPKISINNFIFFKAVCYLVVSSAGMYVKKNFPSGDFIVGPKNIHAQ